MTSKAPAWVGPSAPTNPARSIAKRTGRALNGDVVHDLVVGALQEGRVDRGEWLVAFHGEPGGEGHRVLLGDADVECSGSGKTSANRSSPVPDGIAAVIATIFSSAFASSISALANTLV